MLIQNALVPTVDGPLFHDGHGDGHDDGPKETPVIGDPDGAVVPEVADAPGNTSTPYTISVGDSFEGTINNTDVDYIAINLTAGQLIQVSVTGDDPRIWVLNSSGDAFEYNDDIDFNGGNYDSFLTFEATYTGTYYFAVNGYNTVASDYTLTVDTFTPIADGTVQDMADYLTTGYWTQNGLTGRAFDTSGDNIITVNINGLSAEGQKLARWAFEAWEMVADIVFQEVSTTADITFQDTDDGAWSSSTVSAGEILSSTVNVSTDWLTTYGTSVNSYSFQTYIHEIGHALGLGHQGGYNGAAEYGTDEDFGNDSWQMSIMSYFDQTDSLGTHASYANIMSAMMVDIVAIQDLYGAAGGSSATAGNTVWGPGSLLNGYLGDFFNGVISSTGPVALTIYDYSGIDLMDFTAFGDNARINMNGGEFSDVGGLVGNLGIAVGTVIENVNTGIGNDHVTGNAANNAINTNAGNDIVWSGNGDDTVMGDTGDDTLGGQNGSDEVYGGGGNDYLLGGGGHDVLGGGDGNDSILGGGGADTVQGGNGKDWIRGGEGNDYILGKDGNDSVWGQGGDDRLYGGNDQDVLVGGGGHDSLYGGAGNDFLNGGNGADSLAGSNGNDRIFGGYGPDTLSGGAGNDTLVGENGNDLLMGGSGDDELDFGVGNDVGYGGTGADTFVFSLGVGSNNNVADFSVADGDRLQLDDQLWTPPIGGPVLTEADVITAFGADVGGDFVLSFGPDIITLTGMAGQFDASMLDIV